jgi:hypothetical protein
MPQRLASKNRLHRIAPHCTALDARNDQGTKKARGRTRISAWYLPHQENLTITEDVVQW